MRPAHLESLYLLFEGLCFSALRSGGWDLHFGVVPRPPPADYVTSNHGLRILDPRGLLMCTEERDVKRVYL